MDWINWLRGVGSALLAAVCAGFSLLGPFVGIFAAAMVLDYLTGMVRAAYTGSLNSRIGLTGILKKLGYCAMVAAAVLFDWAVQQGSSLLGLHNPISGWFALLVLLWLIVNELISVLENLGELNLPLPGFFYTILQRLRRQVEDTAAQSADDDQMQQQTLPD